MKRFKVGNHVRGTAGSQGKYTQPGELLEAAQKRTPLPTRPCQKAARKKTQSNKAVLTDTV